MSGITLQSIRIKNFGPFAEEVMFTTSVDKAKKEHEENTFQIGDSVFNKVSYIYGANGAGKSNFCKAIIQIQRIINLSPLIAADNPQLLELHPIKLSANDLDRHFLFDIASKEKPAEYGIEIMINGILYSYSFAILDGKIINETLTKKRRRTEVILTRTAPHYTRISLKSELSSFANNVSVVKDQVLCLSMAAFLNNPLALDIISAINNIRVVNMASITGLRTLTQENFTDEIRERCLGILKKTDPTLTNLDVKFTEKIDTHKLLMGMEDLEGRELIIKDVKVDVQSSHEVYEKNSVVDKILLPFLKYESTGTIKMLSILPMLFYSLENGYPIVIDELENGLHPNLVNHILSLFLSHDTNPLNAQLICTTHSLYLVESGVRRDQVWVISKDEFGKSKMERISNYLGTRTTDNIAEKYLKQAFGAVPSFNERAQY